LICFSGYNEVAVNIKDPNSNRHIANVQIEIQPDLIMVASYKTSGLSLYHTTKEKHSE
jgi:hypothetical protein